VQLHASEQRVNNTPPKLQQANGFKCYEMVLTHVNDVISISETPMRVIEQ
jgi:hypothetical protein